MHKNLTFLPIFLFCFFAGCGQTPRPGSQKHTDTKTIPAAERLEAYLPLLQGKRIAIFANQTSMVGSTHLVDTLLKRGIDIRKIFAPEHGFRGTADAGETVVNYVDKETDVPVISLYGKKRKPDQKDLADVDAIVFDIQDVGVRFFTYISSLEDLAESAIEYDKPLIVLDRPNPNGFYVDGPIMEPRFRSFLGKQEIPVVYGMTIGEYASMLKGEKLIDSIIRKKTGRNLQLTVIPCNNYSHLTKYILPVKPSPNLPDMASVYLYPSTCFFEGTALSEGRGTDRPFQVFGHPSLPDSLYSFTPRSMEGAKNPKLLGKTCYGWDLGSADIGEVLRKTGNHIQLKWLITAYQLFPSKDNFFIHNGETFNRLAGNAELLKQIRKGEPEAAIRATWKPHIDRFKKIRKKYLLYPDFE